MGAGGERGQATVEWVGVVCLFALLFAAILALAGLRPAGTSLAEAIAQRILCAVSLSGECERTSALVSQYGRDVAALVADHAPQIFYEPGEAEIPVDFRRCRQVACDTAAASGEASRTSEGIPVAAFVHVVDCREDALASSRAAGYDCDGERDGNLYIQYWTYYADSVVTFRGVPIAELSGTHADDWEGYQVRIAPAGNLARASSHHGYNYVQSPGNWSSDAGVGPLNDIVEALGGRPEGGWGPETGSFYVSSGSHAGNVRDDSIGHERWTPADRIELIPIEALPDSDAAATFSVTPPWQKGVYHDPESEGT